MVIIMACDRGRVQRGGGGFSLDKLKKGILKEHCSGSYFVMSVNCTGTSEPLDMVLMKEGSEQEGVRNRCENATADSIYHFRI